MDVYHKVLTKAFKLSGGKEIVEVDVGEIIKAEGFFPSRDQITQHMIAEGWMAETKKPYVFKITHWGIAEAKKVLSDAPDNSRAIDKDSKRLISEAREFIVMMEEFYGEPSAERFKLIEQRYSDMGPTVARLKSNLG